MRVVNPQAREYYLTETATLGWSVRQLERNIHTLYSEQLFASKYRLILPTEEELAAELDREHRMIMEQRAVYEVGGV